MTANPFAALPRYSLIDGNMMRATSGDYVHVSDLAALAAAVPADLAEAGKVADAADIYQFWVGDNLVNLGQTIRSLLARLAAQAARIEGLEAALVKINVGEGWAAKLAREALNGSDHEPT